MGNQSAVRQRAGLQRFNLRIPLLKEGQLGHIVAQTDMLSVRIKSYAHGGENGLHAHTNEDHAFVVLQGEAEFRDANGQVTIIGRHEGVMLPRGSLYNFQSRGDEPLILLRVGASLELADRVGADGQPLEPHSPDNKYQPPIPIEGAFFG